MGKDTIVAHERRHCRGALRLIEVRRGAALVVQAYSYSLPYCTYCDTIGHRDSRADYAEGNKRTMRYYIFLALAGLTLFLDMLLFGLGLARPGLRLQFAGPMTALAVSRAAPQARPTATPTPKP